MQQYPQGLAKFAIRLAEHEYFTEVITGRRPKLNKRDTLLHIRQTAIDILHGSYALHKRWLPAEIAEQEMQLLLEIMDLLEAQYANKNNKAQRRTKKSGGVG